MGDKIFNFLIKGIFILAFIAFIANMYLIIAVGVKLDKEYNENNKSIGRTIGSFIKDVNEGMK